MFFKTRGRVSVISHLRGFVLRWEMTGFVLRWEMTGFALRWEMT